MSLVIEDPQVERLAKQIAAVEGTTVSEVLRSSLLSQAALRGLGPLARDVDASSYEHGSTTLTPRTDRSDALQKAHEAAAYDQWFREQVQEGLDETGPGIPHEAVKAEFAAKCEALRRRIEVEVR